LEGLGGRDFEVRGGGAGGYAFTNTGCTCMIGHFKRVFCGHLAAALSFVTWAGRSRAARVRPAFSLRPDLAAWTNPQLRDVVGAKSSRRDDELLGPVHAFVEGGQKHKEWSEMEGQRRQSGDDDPSRVCPSAQLRVRPFLSKTRRSFSLYSSLLLLLFVLYNFLYIYTIATIYRCCAGIP
jgi:hypothetical protein